MKTGTRSEQGPRLIKIGGGPLSNPDTLAAIAASVAAQGEPIVIVHGGGEAISSLQERLGLEPRKVQGLRVTDPATLEAVELALSGKVNKDLVAALMAAGVDAIGLSGVDRGCLRCRRKTLQGVDMGLIGEVCRVRTEVFDQALAQGCSVVLSPISLGEDGQRYNVNADDAATALALALGARQLDYVSDVPGVLVDGILQPALDAAAAEVLMDSGSIHGGMLPKVRGALAAVEAGLDCVRIVDAAGIAGEGGTRFGSAGPTEPGKMELESSTQPAAGTGDAQGLIEREARLLVQTYTRPPMLMTRGQGSRLFDDAGRSYVDFTSGIAVGALGHSDPDWAAVVADQARRLTHVSNLYYTEPQVRLAEHLVRRSFADRVFFTNSGAEAVETALKLARRAARAEADAQGLEADALPERQEILAFKGGFHGRTLGALSVTAKPIYRAPFKPLLPDVRFLPFGDGAAAKAAISPRTAAVIVEPVQGEGGVRPAPQGFLEALREACDAAGALLIFDEVQCGLGRSGDLWAHERSGVTPDIMTLAKPLAGGLPIGAALCTEAVAANIQVGEHGSTFAGGPLVCRAACHVLERIDQPDFLASVREKGERLRAGLNAMEDPRIVESRGRGLLLGLELSEPVAAVVDAARERGLLVISAGPNTLRICPPLVIEQETIDAGLAILAQSLAASR